MLLFIQLDPSYFYSVRKKNTWDIFQVSPLCLQLFDVRISCAGPLKNALDWGSRPPNCWADRAAAIVSASGGSGGSRSMYHIRQVGVFMDIHFITKPEVFIKAQQPPKKFDSDGNLIDPEIKEELKDMLLSLQAFALRLQGKPANSKHAA
mgnify:CR=1 FL=1